ncbi:trissin receptor-like [Pomacea canaliculata]|uniref:trissin receptor-like n=1 Tax=Pomacea canaliculata TaxID=400727 RepID=UPI000D72F0D5|nr:trissin receptor-like [Pomacea canaliculata]
MKAKKTYPSAEDTMNNTTTSNNTVDEPCGMEASVMATEICLNDNETVHLPQVEMTLPRYLYVYATFLNVVIFVVGVVGNLMVILVITCMRSMRTRMNYFLLSLSIADVLVLTVCQPSALMVFYSKDQWLIGEFMCKLVPFLEHATLHSSVLTLLAIAVERYRSVRHPLRDFCQEPVGYNSCPVVVSAWLLGGVLSLPFVFYTWLVEEEYYDGSRVVTCRTVTTPPLGSAYVVLLFVVFFVLPMLSMGFIYASIIRKLVRLSHGGDGDAALSASAGAREGRGVVFRSSQSLRSSRSSRVSHVTYRRPCGAAFDRFQKRVLQVRRRVVLMMGAIVCLFFVTQLPFKVVTLWVTFGSSRSKESLGFEAYYNVLSTAQLVTYVNSAGNPIIYALLSHKFRRAFRKLLSRKCCSI